MTSRISLLSAGLLSLFILAPNAASADNHGAKVGNLEITKAWVRAAPPNARNGGGYLTITNHGMVADKLLGATSNVSAKTELHNHIMTMASCACAKSCMLIYPSTVRRFSSPAAGTSCS